MNTTNNFSSSDNFLMPARPSGLLNTLTVLTIIGSIISLLSSVWNFINAKKGYEDLKKVMDSGQLENAPGFVKNMVNADTLELARVAMENKWPIMIMGVLGAVMCLYGAIEMRKLKKQGYFFWLTGEILPIVGSLLLLGFGTLNSWATIMYIFPVAFLILYSVCKKELINE